MVYWMTADRMHSEILGSKGTQKSKEITTKIDNTRIDIKKPRVLKLGALDKLSFSIKNTNTDDLANMARSLESVDPMAALKIKSYLNEQRKIEDSLNESYGEVMVDNIGNSPDNEQKSLSKVAALLKNKHFKNFLTNILGKHSASIVSWKTKSKRIIERALNNDKKYDERIKDNNGGENGEIGRVPIFEEYLLENDSTEAFREFLTSKECLEGIVLPYLDSHADKNGDITGKFEKDLDARVRSAWRQKLIKDYNTTYQLIPHEKSEKMSQKGNTIVQKIDDIINSYQEGGGDFSGDGLPQSLDSAINEILGDQLGNQEFKKSFDDYLRNSIKAYIGNNIGEDSELQYTGESNFDLTLRSYLYLYGKIYYHNDFKPRGGSLKSYEPDFKDIYELIKNDGDYEKVKKNKYLKAEEERARLQELLRRRSREEAFKRNRERNSGIKSGHLGVESRSLTENGGSIDLNNASGSQIAQGWELGKQITQFDKETSVEMPERDKVFLNRTAFHEAANTFFERNEKLRSFIPIYDFKKFFNITKNGISFNDKGWDNFKNGWIKKNGNMDNESLDEIENLLRIGFIDEFNDSVKALTLSCKDKMGDVHNIVKDHAIGAVIDNVKDAFDNLVRTNTSGEYFQGFKYNESEPVKIDGDTMIISGRFRGETLNLSYNVKTGELKMSEYIHNLGDKEGSGFVVGSTEPTLSIGTIESFDKILDSFYNSPTASLSDGISERFGRRRPSQNNSGDTGNRDNELGEHNDKSPDIQRPRPHGRRGEAIRQSKSQADRLRLQQICGTKIDEIGFRIREELGKHTTENSILSGMLKTFGISSKYETVTFTKGSDFYTFTQIVKNSDQQALNDFLAKMPKFMKLLGLKWGDESDQRKDQSKDLADSIRSFSEGGYKNEDNEGDIISYLQEHSTNFNNEKKAVTSAQFDNPLNFGMLNVFNEKFSSENGNNGKLVSWKMDELMIQIDDAFAVRKLV